MVVLLAALVSAVAVAAAAPQQDKAYPAPGSTDVWPGVVVSYGFDQPMDRASVEQAFSLVPAAEGAFRWLNDDRQLQFRPAEPLAAETLHTVTIGTGARTARGTAVFTQPFSWAFATSRDGAQIGFGYQTVPVQFVTPAGKRGVPLQPGYPRLSLDAALYALDMPALAARYASVRPGQPVIATEGLARVAAWRAHVDASEESGRLPLPAGVAPGLYVLDVRSPRVEPAQTFLVFSDYALVAKEGREGQLAWVARVPEGVITPAADVSLFDAAGALLATAASDQDGLVRFSAEGARFAVADVAGQRTLVGLDSTWFSSGYYWRWWGVDWMPTPPELAAHLHTDRPIYRPGHTVHYKATLRRLTADGFTLPPPTTAVTVTVKDAAGNTVSTRADLALDAHGSVYSSLPLGTGAALGAWTVAVQAGGQSFSGQFRVEEYVKPDYAVTVETDAAYYVTGDTATVTVRADYYFGQPATDAQVTLRVFRGYYWYSGRTGNEVGSYSGRTGDDGTWSVSVPVQTEVGRGWPEPYFFEAEVVDASRRPVVAEVSVPVHGADFSMAVRNERYGVESGQPVVLTATALHHDSRPAVGRRVTFEVRQYRYRMGRDSYEVVERREQTTDADGRARVSFGGLGEGWYTIGVSASDDRGRTLRVESYAWVFDGARPWYWHEGLALTADRDTYAPGDVASLLVRSPVTSTALVTVQRDDVLDEFVVPVTGAATFELPIRPEYAPNVVVQVHLWQTVNDTYRQAEGQLISAEVNLTVPALDRRLSVEIVPDEPERAPGDQAAFTVRVRDAAGRGVRAQLSFALVDKALLALAADTSGDIFDAFWGQRPNTVRTYDSLRPSGWYNYGLEDGQRGGQPPSPGAPATATPTTGAEEEQPSLATPRREFPDTAYWDPAIETDEGGEAVVRLTLPDNLTTWKALARAIAADSSAGQGQGELVVTKAVMADLALPRFAVQGDEFALDVLGRNYVGGTLEAGVTLEAPGLVALDPGPRSLSLAVNRTHTARWSTVASTIGTNLVTARLTTAAGDDAIELPFRVQAFAIPERFARAGSTEDVVVESFDVPYNAIPDGSSVEVRLAPGIAFGVLDGLEDLIGYPYGCVEQTMSRMLPNAVVGRLVRELGVSAPEIEAQLPDMMAVGLQKLYGFQNGNGSWGWWHWEHSEGGVYMTAYVLHGLTLTAAAGYDVDPAVLERGFRWLDEALVAERDPRVAAYAAYVQAIAGRGDAALPAALAARADELDAFAKAALALALDKVGRADLAAGLLDALEGAAVETLTTAHWPVDWGRDPWRWYYWASMANTEKNTAMALDALATLRPDSPLAAKGARWLMENRWGRGWRTTQGTAFAVLALTDYLINSGELDAEYAWSVLLDGTVMASGLVDRENVTRRIEPVVIGGESLTPGTHEIELRKQGRGTLFYTVVGRLAIFSDGFAPAQADGLGVALRRSYTGVVGRSGPDGWAVGDVVNVRLELTTVEELHFMIVEDLLPAGFEGLNESLDTESSRVPGGAPPWRWWGYERKEVRDDRVTFFASHLPPGTHHFEYAARAITPGTFSARPAEAYAMYRPEVWGRSSSEVVRVAADRVAERPDLPGDFDRDCRLSAFDTQLVAEAWGTGRRDVSGSGRTDVADIAIANGRVGLACGDGVPLPPAPGGELDLALRAPDDVRQGDVFELEVVLRGAGNVGAAELSLELPRADFELVDVVAGDLLATPRLLGPRADGAAVRVGAFAPDGAALDGEAVVLRVRLRALQAGSGSIGVARAQVVTDRGAEYRVTADGAVVSPDPWSPRGVAYLPAVSR